MKQTGIIFFLLWILLPCWISAKALNIENESYSFYKQSSSKSDQSEGFTLYGDNLRATGGGAGDGSDFDSGGGEENNGGVNDPGTIPDPSPVGDCLPWLMMLAGIYWIIRNFKILNIKKTTNY
jgi:hypothetical protein